MATITVQGYNATKDDDRRMVEAAVDINVGLLWGYDSDGKAVLATNATGENVRAEGIMVVGSASSWGSEIEFNNTPKMASGKSFRPIRCATYQNEGSTPFETYSNAQLGDPVYLGEDGLITLDEPAVGGDLIQIVGRVKSKSAVEIDLDLGFAAITQAE